MSTTTTPNTAEVAAQIAPQRRGQLAIVVADRGHVWVGWVRDDGPYMLAVEEARVVRRWGTTNGLNELAAKGPRPNTKLDAPATVHVAKRALIALITCEPASWAA